MTFTMAASFIGGIGLFLLGMRMMTDGLKYAAGGALKFIIAKSTSTPLHGIVTGAFITALVQSSSAITVTVIGFVNAGMMNLAQAVTLVYGSNIGTTMTGWLVATLGVKVNIKAMALPAVGVGMLLRTVYAGKRQGGFGEALAGFGLFFVGIGELTSAFGDLGNSIQLSVFAGQGFMHLALFVFIGTVMTFLMQASGAAMAIALTAATGGVIPINTAAAMVIGANVGTTTTAVLATLDATSNAKRTAAAHVIFNIITGIVALLLLPIMLNNLQTIRQSIGLTEEPAVMLALFHTTFNILGVILFLPATKSLVRFLSGHFRSVEEDESRTQYIDSTVLSTPVLALQALAKELGRIGNIAHRMAKGAISSEGIPGQRLKTDKIILDRLVDAVAAFISQVQRTNLPPELDDLLPNAMRISGYYSTVAELAIEIAGDKTFMKPLAAPELKEELSLFKSNIVKLIKISDTLKEDFSLEKNASLLKHLQKDYHQLKSKLLRASTQGKLTSRQVVALLERESKIRRIAEQTEKAARYLTGLIELSAIKDEKEINQIAS